VLDGELVCLDGDGRPQFYDLLRRRGTTYFYAFDLIECDGRDLRGLPLIERKQHLRRLLGPNCRRLLYVDHLDGRGAGLFRVCCEQDLEGVVGKWKYGRYFAVRSNRQTGGSCCTPAIRLWRRGSRG
jgi:bifunctional non-homologous end joining protein LigD